MERSRRGLSLAALLSLVLGVAIAGCGPTQSTSLIMDADVELQAARTADAPKLSPYEYTAATEYLRKAREEQGYSDFEVSIDFAEKALKHARDAKEKAMAAKAEGALPTLAPSSEPGEPAPKLTVEKSE